MIGISNHMKHSPMSPSPTQEHTKPTILMLDEIELATDQLAALSAIANVIHCTSTTREEFFGDLGDKYANIFGIYRHFKANKSVTITGRFDAELVSRLPPSLKVICHNGAGYDQIDVAECSRRKIAVANVPSAVDEPTSDTAMFLILACLRQFTVALHQAQQGLFNFQLGLSNNPRGKILGIVGLGGIGKALARKAKVFGMNVQYYNRTRIPLDQESQLGISYAGSLDALLSSSDVVSLNVPLNSETYHLISEKALSTMKSTAILINTARGPIVDEIALIEALDRGTIAGAGLDVYENEPEIPKALLNNPQAVCLPHVGTVTVETQREMEAICLANLRHTILYGSPPYVVPEQSSR